MSARGHEPHPDVPALAARAGGQSYVLNLRFFIIKTASLATPSGMKGCKSVPGSGLVPQYSANGSLKKPAKRAAVRSPYAKTHSPLWALQGKSGRFRTRAGHGQIP